MYLCTNWEISSLVLVCMQWQTKGMLRPGQSLKSVSPAVFDSLYPKLQHCVCCKFLSAIKRIFSLP